MKIMIKKSITDNGWKCKCGEKTRDEDGDLKVKCENGRVYCLKCGYFLGVYRE